MTEPRSNEVPTRPFEMGKSTLFTESLKIPMPAGAAVPGQPRKPGESLAATPPATSPSTSK